MLLITPNFFVVSFYISLFQFCCAEKQEYLWKPLVEIATTTFERAFLPQYLDFQQDVLQSEAVSDDCKSDLYQALHSLRLRQNWAVKLFNSWGKFPPSGVTRGTLTDFGDYDQCLSISRPITSQYCLVDVSLPMPSMPQYHNYHQKVEVLPEKDDQLPIKPYAPLRLLGQRNHTFYRHLEDISSIFYYVNLKVGVCLPKRCSTNDIQAVARKSMPCEGQLITLEIKYFCTFLDVNKLGLSFKNVLCETKPKSSWNFNNVQIGAL